MPFTDREIQGLIFGGISYCIPFTTVRTLGAPPYNYKSIDIGLVLLSLGVGQETSVRREAPANNLFVIRKHPWQRIWGHVVRSRPARVSAKKQGSFEKRSESSSCVCTKWRLLMRDISASAEQRQSYVANTSSKPDCLRMDN